MQIEIQSHFFSPGRLVAANLTYRRILTFWSPLAGTWLMMAVEGPYLAAIIARLPEPTANLAGFGVAFAFAIIIEAPVIMLMSASTALVEDRQSYLALRRFAYGLCAVFTAVHVIVLVPQVFDVLARDLLALPEDVTAITHRGLLLLLPWTTAIGYRRFRQGLLIRHNLTRRVAYGTAIRLVTMSVTALAIYRFFSLNGASIGAIALSVGVVVEAIASRAMTADIVPAVLDRGRAPERLSDPILRLSGLSRFYAPLALTSVLALAVQPLITFFMGQSRHALESLAVLPVVHGVTFIFRAIGLSYFEVVIALLGDQRRHYRQIRNFAVALALCTVAGLASIAFTPLARVWLGDVSGLTPTLVTFALPPIQILAVFPALSVLLSLQRGTLVHAHRTSPITWATLLEVTTVGIVLTVSIHRFDLVGATAAALAILSGRMVGIAWLTPAWWGVVHDDHERD